MKQVTLLTAVALSLSVHPIVGATIYDTGPFTADGGAMASDFSSSTTPTSPIQRADDFLFSSTSQITTINWWGQYAFNNTPGPDDFTLRIFADLSGTPASIPLFQFALGNVGRVTTGVVSFGSDVYGYSGVLSSPVTLSGGTTYWLSIVNNTASDANDNWYWQRVSRFTGSVQSRNTDVSPWGVIEPSTLAFNLQGSVVPEPSFLALLLVGGTSLAFTVRKGQS